MVPARVCFGTLVVALVLIVSSCGSTSTTAQAQPDIASGRPAATPAPTLVPGQAPSPVPVDEAVAGSPAPTDESADTDAGTDEVVGDGLFPTVVDATASASGDASWRVDVTLSSEYDSPDRYADAWRVLDADANELGIRVLSHDHANEQPFTRSHTIEIPEGTTTVFIEGRDQVNGWSGERFELSLIP